MKKIFKILSICSLSFITGVAGLVSTLTLNNSIQNKNVSQINKTLNDDVKKDKTPIDYYGKTPILTQKTGPIISYGDKISALDWYGSTLWSFNFQDVSNHKYYPGNNPNDHPNWVNRAFLNWALDTKNNRLWLLTNSTTTSKAQNVIEIDSNNGKVLSCITLNFQPKSNWEYFYFIQVLNNGNIQIYGYGSDDWGKNILIDRTTKKQTINSVKTSAWETEIKNSYKHYNVTVKGRISLYYLVPVANNVNVAVFCDFNSAHKPNNGTNDLLLVLVDDNLKQIKVNDSSPWKYGLYIKQNIDDKQGNQSDNFSKTIYSTLNGRIYFTAWQKFFVFFPEYKDGYGIPYAVYEFSSGQRVLSYTMDVNENVFIKFWDDTKIYKLTISDDTAENTKFSSSTYYDVGSSQIKEVKDNAKNFVLYNVTGYTGSIMMLSSRIINSGTEINNKTDGADYSNYGIAVAVTPNQKEEGSGDSQGLLNTENSFTKSSDFNISNDILANKLPSEITKNDLTLENGGFFTNNTTKENGKLKYPPFKLENVNDSSGTFDVVANLDQIPWFATKLPDGSIPKTIKKSFRTTTTINSKVSWKGQDTLSYDFKNTLPTKVTVDDLNNFDPFQVSFNSKVILDSKGSQQYPKKIYSIKSSDDSNGTITIGIKYEYIPLSSDENTVLSYDATQTYTIFDTKKEKQFYFAGAVSKATSENSSQINIKDIPQLKSLSESNLLPSSFNGNNKNSFLQFINTNKSQGYPISKMNFSVIPNDVDGTLKVIASVDKNYDENNQTFVQTFSGFNKKNDYSFSFNGSVTSINGKTFSTMLASSINEGDIVSNLITYTGFNSSDFEVKLYPDDNNGKLTVQINLDKSYVEALGNSNGFTNYKITHEFSGFMTNESYNNQYNVTFKQDDNKDLIDLKKMTLSTIQDAFKNNKTLTVNGKNYKSLNDLTEKLFVDTLGSKVPNDWDSHKDKIKTNMSIDNQAGTMNLAVTIDKSLLDGYESNLAYVISYSGFSKGNAIVTADNLTFVSNDLLKVYTPEIKGMSASQLEEWLKQDTKRITKLLFNFTGQYKEKIDNQNFKLDIDANDSYNTISITIKFDELTNKDSLKEYSVQYQL